MNSRSRMTLKSSVVIFRALETSTASLTSAASAASLASTASTALFPQKTSWSWVFYHLWHQNDQYWSLKSGLNHQKSNFSLISVSLSVGGCWGQNMLLFCKLVWWNSNSLISGIYRYLQTKSNLHIFICQTQLKIYTLPWGTLYVLKNRL